jgi:hypothetical protein
MENNFAEKCWMECLVRYKIKHQKKYKIGKSLTSLGKISIVDLIFTWFTTKYQEGEKC